MDLFLLIFALFITVSFIRLFRFGGGGESIQQACVSALIFGLLELDLRGESEKREREKKLVLLYDKVGHYSAIKNCSLGISLLYFFFFLFFFKLCQFSLNL